jgi:hypothetical protein
VGDGEDDHRSKIAYEGEPTTDRLGKAAEQAKTRHDASAGDAGRGSRRSRVFRPWSETARPRDFA